MGACVPCWRNEYIDVTLAAHWDHVDLVDH